MLHEAWDAFDKLAVCDAVLSGRKWRRGDARGIRSFILGRACCCGFGEGTYSTSMSDTLDAARLFSRKVSHRFKSMVLLPNDVGFDVRRNLVGQSKKQ